MAEGEDLRQNSRKTCGEIAELYFASLRAQRSNPFFLCVVRWIASRGLSSGARSRDPLARNDGFGERADVLLFEK